MQEDHITKQIIVNETPNSYEIGKTGNRHKIYYSTAEDLKAKIDKLKELKLLEEEN